ncbi:MAG: ornithine--oxo-acid transaminase [Pseudobdellovibrionaceae bacterium]|jgi:ornithine--oxo-acid transaminase|nr:ornithine--oxo-acid transaminase [Pseudobdellovibrionaceae bacterium]
MKSQQIIEREDLYLAHNYHPLPVVLTKGDGVWVWDVEGNKYLDFLSAYSAVSAGHHNPRILKAMTDQVSKLGVPSRAFYTDILGEYAEKLCAVTGMDRLLPMNTGAEAVETAIKAARRWGYRVKGIAKDKARIITCLGNFHGRTTTIVSFSSEEAYKDGFGPFSGGFDLIPYGDLKALEAAITPDTCAFLIEPIQGEAGIIVPPEGYLAKAQELCRKHNVLFMLDEIQTGLSRTGKDFCFQYEIDKPDGLTLGKALGGGVYPVSAFLARKDVMDVFDYGSHGSTFGGNPIAAAIGLEALKLMEDDKYSERSFELGEYLRGKLETLQSPLIKEVRGKGLLIGMEIYTDRVSARSICEDLKSRGLLCKETHATTIRFAPPLIITREQIDWAVGEVDTVLKSKAA